MKITCPHCDFEVDVTDYAMGKEIECDFCSKKIILKAPIPSGPILEEPIPDGKVKNQEESDAWFSKWRRELPEVESVYEPSGRITVTGIVWMLVGTVIAIPCGAAAGGILGLALYITDRGYFGLTLASVFASGLAGFVIGTIVASFGERGKNRNSWIAIAFSLVSTLLLLFLIWWWNIIDVSLGVDVVRWWRVTLYMIGSSIALAIAAVSAEGRVAEKRFCESCNEYMKKHKLRGFSYIDTVKFVKAVTDKNMNRARQIMQKETGNRGFPVFYVCPRCCGGYIEIEVKFEANYKTRDEGGSGEKEEWSVEEEWLVCSAPIDPDDGAEFLRLRKAD